MKVVRNVSLDRRVDACVYFENGPTFRRFYTGGRRIKPSRVVAAGNWMNAAPETLRGCRGIQAYSPHRRNRIATAKSCDLMQVNVGLGVGNVDALFIKALFQAFVSRKVHRPIVFAIDPWTHNEVHSAVGEFYYGDG